VCLLLSGGSVLGHAVAKSTLLESVDSILLPELSAFQSIPLCIFALCVFAMCISTFVSHTAAANILVPFIVEISLQLFNHNPVLALTIIIPACLCLSAGMALPVSSVPNINASAICKGGDENNLWIQPHDFIKPGIVSSICTAVIASILGPVMVKITTS
jgi:di/tricarboxylate transporter